MSARRANVPVHREMRPNPYDPESTFWRLQDAGWPLSTGHRSTTWGAEDGHEEIGHAGTSAVRKLSELGSAQACIGMGDVEVVKFVGREVGIGFDGEPVVIPEKELLRFWKRRTPAERRDPWRCFRAKTIRELISDGWVQVETLPIAQQSETRMIYVWALAPDGSPLDQDPYGPYDYLESQEVAKGLALHSSRNYATSFGNDPLAHSFRIVANFDGQTGRRSL